MHNLGDNLLGVTGGLHKVPILTNTGQVNQTRHMARDLIAPIMVSYGFTLKRCNKHRVWKHFSGATVTTSATCSDWRAARNVERDIKRALCAA